jgi:cardiolipin synthase
MKWHWLPNAICVLRLVLVVPIVWLLLDGAYVGALALMIVAGASDGLDGYLAKTFDWRSRLGSLLDPAADKLLLVSVFVALTAAGLVPFALTAIVVGRDLVIVAGALTYQWLIAPVEGNPTSISKLNTACQLGFVVFTITNVAFDWPPPISLLLLGATVIFTSVTSGLTYVLRWSTRAWQMRRAAA